MACESSGKRTCAVLMFGVGVLTGDQGRRTSDCDPFRARSLSQRTKRRTTKGGAVVPSGGGQVGEKRHSEYCSIVNPPVLILWVIETSSAILLPKSPRSVPDPLTERIVAGVLGKRSPGSRSLGRLCGGLAWH